MEASSTHDTAKPISSGNYASPNEITYNHLKQNKLFDGDLDDFNNDIINEEVRRNVYSIMTNDKKFDGSFYDFTVDSFRLEGYDPHPFDEKIEVAV